MRITLGDSGVLDQVVAPIAKPAVDTFQNLPIHSVVANGVPTIDVGQMGDVLVTLGQQILLGASAVVVVVCGILIVVGLKRDGWKKVVSVIQGLGVGLVGPTVVSIVAGLFVGFAKMIS